MALKTSNSYLDFDVKLSGTATYDITTEPGNISKLTAPGPAVTDLFGESVAVGSGRIVIGMANDDDLAINAGAIYIVNLDGAQTKKIRASAAQAYFGDAVAVGCNRIVAGARGDADNGTDSGAAYILSLDGTLIAKIKASDGAASDRFGWSVAVGSGRIVVGAYLDGDNGTDSGSAYVFDLNGNQLAKIKPSDGAASDWFGYSVAVGSGRIVVGAYRNDENGTDSGAAYVFDLNGNQLEKLMAGGSGDAFGESVAVGCGRIVVGAIGDDVTASNSGTAYIFDLNGTQLRKIKPPGLEATDHFGKSVAVGSGLIVIGAYGDDDNGSDSGSAYMIDLNGTVFTKIKPTDGTAASRFGQSVAIGSGRVVFGAPLNADNGSVYIGTISDQKFMLDLLD